MIRHWDKWDEGKRSHLFVADATSGEAKDLTPKLEVNAPPGPFGGSNDYAFAPDGKELAFTAEPAKDAAWSTNTDIWTVPVEGGEPKNFTEANKAADAQPAYSPDGRFLAYVRQDRPGFEADQWKLRIRPIGDGPALDNGRFKVKLPVLSFAWVDSSERAARLVATVDFAGRESIADFKYYLDDRGVFGSKGFDATAIPGGVNTAVRPVTGGGEVFLHNDAAHPNEVHFRAARGGEIALTNHNAPLVEGLDLATAEDFSFKGADGDPVSRLGHQALRDSTPPEEIPRPLR